ncbi:MAG: class I SAM-dependent methyltransferase [Myxococcota bacterium]|nr:class I SAM-dependent methyltransferase [Myxococcota bacterium]
MLDELRLPLVVLLLASLALVCLGPGCRDEPQDEPPPPARVPSSFVDPHDRDVDAYQAIVRKSVGRGEPLHPLFGPRSRSEGVVGKLALKPDDVVADVGCGTGAMELMMLETGVAFGKLYAVDVDGEALAFLEFALEQARPAGADKVEVVKSSYSDVTLPAASVDVLFLLNTPFYLNDKGERIADPTATQCLRSIHRALKPDGRLHVFERSLTPAETDWCEAIRATFTDLGFRKIESAMIGIGVPGEGDHCWTSFAPDPAPGGPG